MAKRWGASLEGEAGILREITSIAARERDPNVRLVVGYEAEYAVWVHERLDVYHANGQAKFLEMPARQYASLIGRIIAAEMRKPRRRLVTALRKGGLRLLEESQKLVPVDTGNLKQSGFVRVEGRPEE